jgi:DNA polymerase-3 subunit epsilon
MRHFAVDVETANNQRSSICQIGLVEVLDDRVVPVYSSLVRPPGNAYNYHNIQVHGIQPEDTRNSPTFEDVWPDIAAYFAHTVWAHNAPFDFGCLTATLEHYYVPVPTWKKGCTYRETRMGLKRACEHYGIILLNHHDALADATACGEVLRRVRMERTPEGLRG